MSQSTDRHAQRIAAIQALYQFDIQGAGFADLLDEFLLGAGISQPDKSYSRKLFTQTHEQLASIDQHIESVSEHWNLSRVGNVDRAILRAAVCELLHIDQVPPKVAINEAVEIAREYGAAESPAFVNGILDAIWKNLESETQVGKAPADGST